MEGKEQVKSLIEQCAIADYEARQEVSRLLMLNTPATEEGRRQAAVDLANARAAAFVAGVELDKAIRGEK